MRNAGQTTDYDKGHKQVRVGMLLAPCSRNQEFFVKGQRKHASVEKVEREKSGWEKRTCTTRYAVAIARNGSEMKTP